MDLKRPRKLNLNAPLLSTRRFGSSVVGDTSCSSYSGAIQNTSERVPFSWEKTPGKPKDAERSVDTQEEGTPRLRLPPRHWFPPTKSGKAYADHGGDDAFHDQGNGNCDDNDDMFSDAMDVFSLSEALDIVQKKSENANSDNNNKLRLKLAESNGYQSPTYMINRFLPDATALAASSAMHFSTNFDDNVCDTCSYPECCYIKDSIRHSYASSPKGCGLELLFPWRMKHKLCAIESPVLPCFTNMHKHHQRSSKQKKHRSSTYIPCTNMKGDI